MKAVKLQCKMISVSQNVDIDIDIDLMDYIDELEDCGFVPVDEAPSINEMERPIGLSEEAARIVRANNPALALSLDDSIMRCRKQMKIAA